MASLQDQAETVKTAVASVETCTPATTVLLKDLLLPKDVDSSATGAKGSKTTKPRTTRPKQSGTTSRAGNKGATGHDRPELSAKEKAMLATHVINATLKSLGDVAKAPPPATPKKPAAREEDLLKTATRRRLRRSNSAPITPMQPRSLNRISTSPEVAKKPPRSTSTANASTGCLSTVECARVAFSVLRSLQNAGKITLPELQLEAGVSSLVGKLISLGLMEHAVKELRLLKKRLDELVAIEQKKAPKSGSSVLSLSLSDILDFHDIKAKSHVLNMAISTQMQVLRVLSKLKRPTDVEAALPFLRTSNKWSPANLLFQCAGSSEEGKAKTARQLETLSQVLLTLAPSTSSSEDDTASEPRLSVSPASALELQTIALQTRLSWWELAGHKADVDKDILAPFSRCLSTYVRRTRDTKTPDYKKCLTAFNSIRDLVSSQELEPSKSSKSPLAGIYQTLARLARESGYYSDAISWVEKLGQMIDRSRDSAARCCATSALLLAYRFKMAWKYPVQDVLLKEVLDGLQGSLRGDSAELEELLDSLVMALKSTMNVLLGSVVDEEGKKYRPPAESSELLESFVIELPRFCLRWLGKRPSSQDNTKEFLRYEQRRTVLAKSASQTLDSVLMLSKGRAEKNQMAWDKLDSLLHDCVGLLDNLEDLAFDPSCCYHAKISHIYYIQHTNFFKSANQKSPPDTKYLTLCLKALRRSIDCVKHRSSKEREKAQILYKLERMGELCREAGRVEDALASVQTLRNILIEDGALNSVAQALKSLPPRRAWVLNQDVEQLSWSLRWIAKMEHVWVDWTLHLDEPERLAALEHRLEFIILRRRTDNLYSDPCVEALLQAYSIEKYPVRRLRVLIRLLMANMGNTELVQVIQARVEEALSVSGEAGLGEDAGLRGFLSHMEALSMSIIALDRQEPDHQRIDRSLSAWRSILGCSEEATDLEQRIDDLPGLLEHLQSVADYSRLSNHNIISLTALQLAADIRLKAAETDTALNLQISAALALQLTNIGQSSKAAMVLEQAQRSYQEGEPRCHEEIVRFLLSYAEYLIEIGDVEKADGVLAQARDAASAIDLSVRTRARKLMLAQASLMYSAVALGRGDAPCALTYARDSARVLFQEWARLEQQSQHGSPGQSTKPSDESGIRPDASLSSIPDKTKDASPKISGPEAWKLAHPVLQGLLFLSNTYAHLGMYQETVYYAEQAQKLAKAANSEAYLAECEAWMSFIAARADKLEDALKTVVGVKSRLDGSGCSSKLVSLCCRLSSIYREASDFESEKVMIEAAEAMVRRMAGGSESVKGVAKEQDTAVGEKKMTKLAIRERRNNTTARKPRAPVAKVAPKKAAVTCPTPATSAIVQPEDAHLVSLKTSVTVEKAISMIHQKDWAGAWHLLQEVRQSSKVASQMLSELVATARSLLGQSMEQMARDAVYSVIQESTLSFPSVCNGSGSDKGSDRFSLMKTTPPRKMAASASHDVSKASSQGYLENLREARDCLLEAHAMASVMGGGREVHRILGMLQTVVILLSAATSSSRKSGILGHPGYATCSVEMARNLTWRREYKALASEKSSGRNGLEWPEEIRSSEARRTSLGPAIDMSKFQREYIDIIPQQWCVVSISLSDNKHDLCISKLQTGQSPFVIRLPLERATSRDADNEVFNFQQGRTELLDIIKRANASCHDKRDFSIKGAKSAWWAEREALDAELKELLERIEQIWLGGFKGIFSQHQRQPDLLAKFQKSFQSILDKYLPSRRQVRGKKTKTPASKIALDLRILELFVGLGDATDAECDFDEMLNDLLYFVVDILQFHGERNAYDEIDFDSMVVETLDALHSYHADAKSLHASNTRSHTILVLDKPLHTFPWESLPCLQGLAVSRVPSLACLRSLILKQRPPPAGSSESDKPDQEIKQQGHHVSVESGTYMLNTSGDLKTTQVTFESPLSSLGSSWKRIINKAPTEAEFETALVSSDILLYMGHGGGAQYIRNRTIRRLDKCRATTLLMGCSSASLADVGDFECYGLVWSYMLAGCPAVVGTLWDVTDKDIDKYTGRVFEEWGLVKRETFGAAEEKSGKGKRKAVEDDAESRSTKKGGRSGSRKRSAMEDEDGGDTACEYGDASLPEAVARARNAGVCRFKYLNAGAVCVYGIPVYVDRSGRAWT